MTVRDTIAAVATPPGAGLDGLRRRNDDFEFGRRRYQKTIHDAFMN